MEVPETILPLGCVIPGARGQPVTSHHQLECRGLGQGFRGEACGVQGAGGSRGPWEDRVTLWLRAGWGLGVFRGGGR